MFFYRINSKSFSGRNNQKNDLASKLVIVVCESKHFGHIKKF